METEQQGTSNNMATIIAALILMFLVQSAFGFLAWASYQTAASGVATLPSITLLTGMGFWWLYFLLVFLPVGLYAMLTSSISNKTKEINNVNTTG